VKELNRSILVDLWYRIEEDDVSGLASQLAYFFLLSLFPLLIVVVSIIPLLPFSEVDLLGFVRDFAPAEAMALIETNLTGIMEHSSGKLLGFGIIGTLWSASNGINAIVRAFNKAYDVKESRNFIVARGMAVLFTFAMTFVFIISLLLPVFGRKIGLFLFSEFGLSQEFLGLWNMGRWLFSSIILFIIFTVLYWMAPNKKIKCVSVMRGAIFSTIGWILTSLAFSYYVGHFGNYSAMYGSIGAIIVLMIWLYLSGFIILLGGEINAYYSKREGC
jgi:membrane protein